MQFVDYTKILDDRYARNDFPPDIAPDEDAYRGRDGIHLRSTDRDNPHSSDVVRLSPHAFLLASDCSLESRRPQHQIVNDCDWVHIQFWIEGGVRELISRQLIETREKTCFISRYPKNTIVEREFARTGRWRVACLFLSPKGLTELLDVPAEKFPASVRWLVREKDEEFRSSVLPLHSTFSLALNDIFGCSLRGEFRRSYMRAKSVELLSTAIHALDCALSEAPHSSIKLTSADLDKLAVAREIMGQHLEGTLTLAQLARRVGLNRTKLAIGFREIYGTSVQAFWRDAKLARARELLRDPDARVTEVALGLGYSELSSFTRAFSRKFGLLPRECKRGAQASATLRRRSA